MAALLSKNCIKQICSLRHWSNIESGRLFNAFFQELDLNIDAFVKAGAAGDDLQKGFSDEKAALNASIYTAIIILS